MICTTGVPVRAILSASLDVATSPSRTTDRKRGSFRVHSRRAVLPEPGEPIRLSISTPFFERSFLIFSAIFSSAAMTDRWIAILRDILLFHLHRFQVHAMPLAVSAGCSTQGT